MIEELATLPRKIVMVEDCGAPGQDVSDRVPRWLVQRKRAEVLDNHQVGSGHSISHGPPVRTLGSADAQSRDCHVDRTFAGHGIGVEAERL